MFLKESICKLKILNPEKDILHEWRYNKDTGKNWVKLSPTDPSLKEILMKKKWKLVVTPLARDINNVNILLDDMAIWQYRYII